MPLDSRTPYQIVEQILEHLDTPSILAFSQTNFHFHEICQHHLYRRNAMARRDERMRSLVCHHDDRGARPNVPVRRNALGHVECHDDGMALPNATQNVATGANTAASVSFASTSASASNAHREDENDEGNASDVEEDEWEFTVTPEMVERLSVIPQRNHHPSLEKLPKELQFIIFKNLDKIDSCCLGLAHPNLYVVYRAVHGTKMPLNTRRIGPNLLEAAWEVVTPQRCKYCDVYRCELHTHIKNWMPSALEYCSIKVNFGLPAGKDKSPTCYRGKPSKPKRCGRHPARTTSIHLNDGQAATAVMIAAT